MLNRKESTGSAEPPPFAKGGRGFHASFLAIFRRRGCRPQSAGDSPFRILYSLHNHSINDKFMVKIMKNKIFISALLVLFFVTLFFSNKSFEKNNKDKNENPADIKKLEYLQNNMAEINIDEDSFDVLADFNKSIKNYDIFLIGEKYWVSKNYDIIFYLLKNFNQNHGVRYILLESGLGFSDGKLLNKYLQSGDKKILNSIFKSRLNNVFYAREEYEFYIKVCEYNKTLPKNKKLVFIGIDIQHQIIIGKNYIFDILSSPPPENILKKINKFKQKWDDNKLISILDDNQYIKELEYEIQIILEDMDDEYEIYMEYLADEYFDFKFACENILQALDCYKDDSAKFYKRKNYIQNNFETLYTHYGNEKYCGYFGDNNILLTYSPLGVQTIGSFIENEYEPTKGKTFSLIFIYNNCKSATHLGDYTPIDVQAPDSIDKKTFSCLISLSKSDFTLFNLINNGSPFAKLTPNTDKIYTAYGFQYCILIQNSPAVKKLNLVS